jgi:hypothetical protein
VSVDREVSAPLPTRRVERTVGNGETDSGGELITPYLFNGELYVKLFSCTLSVGLDYILSLRQPTSSR